MIQTSVSVICLSFASADNADLRLNIFCYPAQPHPIILNYSALNMRQIGFNF